MTKALIWTRSSEDDGRDKPLFKATTIPVHRLPCLATTWLENPIFPRVPATAMALTSPRAVLGLERHANLMALATKLPLHTFGTETTARLRALKLKVIRHDASSAAELAQKLVEKLGPHDVLWVPGAKEPAYDLVGHLHRAKRQAFLLALYETVPTSPTLSSLLSLLKEHENLIVCFASPSAVAGFAPLLRQLSPSAVEKLAACAIGETTAQAARRHFKTVHVSPKPDLVALIATATCL